MQTRLKDQLAAEANFTDDGTDAYCLNVAVEQDYRRQGIANAMYLFAEKVFSKTLEVQGAVGFNDCSTPAVDKVIRFLMTHRRYEEMDVGLPKSYTGKSRKRDLLRFLVLGRKDQWYRRSEDRYFRKLAEWEPNCDYFAEF